MNSSSRSHKNARLTLSLSRKEDARRLRLRLQSIALGTREKEERAKDPLFGKSAERIWRRLIETREKIETKPKILPLSPFFSFQKGKKRFFVATVQKQTRFCCTKRNTQTERENRTTLSRRFESEAAHRDAMLWCFRREESVAMTTTTTMMMMRSKNDYRHQN